MSASPDYWGARSAGQPRARTISTASASSSTATGRPRSKPSRRATSSTGRNSPRAPGRPATIFRRSPPARSSSASFPARTGRPCRRWPSTSAASGSATRACARRSRCASTSNGRKRNLFYGAYERSQSCFERSDYKAEGMPSPEELALLEPLRDKLPPEAFGEAVMQPVSDGSGRDRKLLVAGVQAARRGRLEARRQRFVVNDKGERLAVEYPGRGRELHPRHFALGREHEGDRHRRLDPAGRFGAVPGAAGRFRFRPDLDCACPSPPRRRATRSTGCSIRAPPTLPGSRNLPGTADPAVDALIDAVGAADGPREA